MTNKDRVSIPGRFLSPIKNFLESELLKLKRTEKSIKAADPFSDETRGLTNSAEDDLDEQIGHFDSEIKASFVKKQIVQLRKALTRIKIGNYGVCEKCGKMIDTDRLAIRPETTVCIKCEKEQE
ncbi:MAG TPA: TraR/DksA C4-type zinc finger protein [Candidatus Woesebacteria bacterium]|nr:TraR/DksA C4-type zinc finger protein [Candidatus Woesebacteria bacterium]HPJ17180.1 TraR/DksA C4-type zinc finger protein [Candidatus Woesebacteria bacterium]